MNSHFQLFLKITVCLCAACSLSLGAGTRAAAHDSVDRHTPPDVSPITLPAPKKKYTPLDYQAVQPNEAGQIMILMYHGLDPVKQSASYMRTVEGFKSDLQRLYDNGFRTVSVADLINNEIKVEAGYSPVVITFDDGMSSAFSLAEEDGKLVPAKDCAVDIMNKFAEKHPDFGRNAVFFINGAGRPPFHGAGTLADRFGYLIGNGYDIGNHTYSHKSMDKLNAGQIQEEMAKLEKLVADNAPGYRMQAVAYPYGVRPRQGLREYALKGEHDGVSYDYKLAMRAAPVGTSATPNNNYYEPDNMPRVRGTDMEPTDLGWFLREFQTRPELKYVSDGNPYVITVPSTFTQKLNTASFSERILYLYETAQ